MSPEELRDLVVRMAEDAVTQSTGCLNEPQRRAIRRAAERVCSPEAVEAYANRPGGRQKFETMRPLELWNEARKEVQDIVTYGAMVAARLDDYQELFEAQDRWIELGEPPIREALAATPQGPRPTVVCLCGSTRFKQEFVDANFRETMAGKIVLSVGFYSHDPDQAYTPTEEEKRRLDELHKRKIDLADEVLIINQGHYIGDSTRSELEYAVRAGKPVRFLEPLVGGRP